MKRMTSRYWLWAAAICLLATCLNFTTAIAQNSPEGTLEGVAPPPAQPGEEAWTFIDDLKSPLWDRHMWSPREAAAEEADLRSGVRVHARFPDPEGLLKTAYTDLGDFLAAGDVPQDGPYVIETDKVETSKAEAYRIDVTKDRCRILAADTEGIRRGVFQVEDMMLRAGGPFLPLGALERKPFIKSRISRCFFGPIKRPPKNRDELMDDVDYYPEQYLNRLAHEGINGLWLTVAFKDLCKTNIVPEYGKTADRRLAKLRKTVEKCRRYGIRIYIFTTEPAAWDADLQALKKHPQLASFPHPYSKGQLMCCPWSDAAQQYLYEATNSIFSAVPHLGGLINITHGERCTNCQSAITATSGARPACPVCARKEPWQVLRKTLEPMAEGIKDADPNAELIAWFYMPQSDDLAEWVYEIPKHMPENVVCQFNFESGVVKEVFGKKRIGGDYWISTPGPSHRFVRMARNSQKAGGSLSAKIQTGCSHEVATVPFVPVPGLLYQKFRAMRELGVSRVMLCWYFGNYPGIMNKAAGELSFEPFPKSEKEFLRRLASIEWGRKSEAVAQAWQKFAEGYGHYPLANYFQYYGPMHDGVVWPLLLRPQDAPLAPTWQIASPWSQKPYAPSGDRVGEALGPSFTLDEGVQLCRMMSDRWSEGVDILRRVETDRNLSARRRLDIGVARALGIQFRSGANILRFYDLRERMANEKPKQQLATLAEMRRIVEDELKGDSELIGLCRNDSRLGFHSEAEGYKYFPEKIRWRMRQLQKVLDVEIPALKSEIERGADPFAAYTGRKPKGPTAHSAYCDDIGKIIEDPTKKLPVGLIWQTCSPVDAAKPQPINTRNIRWTCCHDDEAFYLLYTCNNPEANGKESAKPPGLVLTLEARRLRLCRDYYIWPTIETKDGWRGCIRIPFDQLAVDSKAPSPLRINVRPTTPKPGERPWIPLHRWPHRLLLGGYNPADLGWVIFEKKP